MNNSWYKKEKPLLGLTGLGGGVDGLSVVGASVKTYIDDVFSNYVYVGNESTKTITNGVDNSTEGGLVWTKCRDGSSDMHHILFDTARGVTKDLLSSAAGAEGTSTTMVTAFNENGYTLGNSGYVNENDADYVSWNFRKAPGFFDIVTWTGNGSSQAISHSLKSIPGVIFIKRLSASHDWVVYNCHGGIASNDPFTYFSKLNTTGAEANYTDMVTATSSTTFTVGSNSGVNTNAQTYIAYIFAGGASTASTAKSIDVPSGSNLSIPDDNAWNLGQTFTIEAWVNPDNFDSNYNTIVAQAAGENNWYFSILNSGTCQFHNFNGTGGSLNSLTGVIPTKQWTHIAFVCNSGTGQWYVNGTASGSTASYDVDGGAGGLTIGRQGSSWPYDGKISNLRIVNGTAVYTSSFVPPTSPLTNITNTVLLCCNDASVTGSTVTPGTITNSGVSASDLSPFADPAGFKFGVAGDQNLVKVGTYLGNASDAGPVVDLGWEPQFLITKQLTSASPWMMFDVKRDILTGGNEALISANSNLNETSTTDYLQLTPTGFEIVTNDSDINDSFETYAYIAIRRPDGYVGKPVEAGTDVFTTDTGNASSIGPAFDGNFAVDMLIKRAYSTTSDWGIHFRLTGPKDLRTNTTDIEGNDANGGVFDFMNGVSINQSSSILGWMWKRHAGFDVVAYEGNSENSRIIRHSLGAVPEMIWVKNRDDTTNWIVGNHGLDGGTDPWTHYLYLNTNDAEGDYDFFVDKAPTAYSFEVTTGSLNDTNKSYVALLFKSVAGISKIGSYDGSSSSGAQTITTGFQPRFLLFKKTTGSGDWYLFDATQGWGNRMILNTNVAQDSEGYVSSVGSTGFTLSASHIINGTGSSYIYYAHA